MSRARIVNLREDECASEEYEMTEGQFLNYCNHPNKQIQKKGAGALNCVECKEFKPRED